MSYILYDPEAPVITPRRPKRDCTKIVLTDDQQQWLRDNYATTLNKDCAAHLGISESSVHRWARQLGLTKDPDWFHALVMERVRMMAAVNRGPGNHGKKNLLIYGAPHRFKKGVTSRERLGDEKELQRLEKSAATRRETIRKERMRINWGFEQQTRLKIGHDRKRALTRYALKKRGYIIPERAARVAYWDSNTNRSPIVEQHAADRGITIASINTIASI